MKRRALIKALGGAAGLALVPSLRATPVAQTNTVLTIVGLGGTGGRIVSKFAAGAPEYCSASPAKPKLYAIDTDLRSLERVSDDVRQIWLPASLMQSSGSCIYPRDGRQAAWRYRNLVAPILEGADDNHQDVILVAGFGGGAGTGLAQALSLQLQNRAICSRLLLAMPFSWEVRPIHVESELKRLKCATGNHLALYYPDESRPDETLDTILGEVDQQLIADFTQLSPDPRQANATRNVAHSTYAQEDWCDGGSKT